MSRFVYLTLALRGSERSPAVFSRSLDSLKTTTRSWSGFMAQIFPDAEECQVSFAAHPASEKYRLTHVFRSILGDVFSSVRVLPLPGPAAVVRFALDGVEQTMQLRHCLAARSRETDAGGSEGDDLVLVMLFEMVPANAAAPDCPVIDHRFSTPGEATQLLHDLGLLKKWVLASEWYAQPGFYMIPLDKLADDVQPAAIFSDDGDGQMVAAWLVAYLTYCWLLCLRCERLIVAIDLNGDWDVGSRQLILARKRLALAWRYIRLKNRAAPDSPALGLFLGVSRYFRLEVQLDNLSQLLDQVGKAMELHSAYVLARRVRVIEAVLLLSSVLGLGVATNAISMPPFYDIKATDALSRPVFWWVFAAVGIGALAISGLIVLWRLGNRWRWSRKKGGR